MPCSFGSRLGLGPQHALAHLHHRYQQTRATIFTQDDIAGAFDHVQIDLALQDLAHHIPCPRLLCLIAVIARGHDNYPGIDQGDPLSPEILNTHLHHWLDTHILPLLGPDTSYVRYVDDLAWLTRTEAEGSDIHGHTLQCLAGSQLTLKSTTVHNSPLGRPTDLTRDTVQFLGFEISINGDSLQCGLTDDAFQELQEQLNECHRHTNYLQRAQWTLKGWTQAYGAAFGIRTSTYVRRIQSILVDLHFRQLSVEEDLQRMMSEAYSRWRQLLQQMAQG